MAEYQDHFNEAATVVELRSTITRCPRQFQKKKHKNSELVDAVHHAFGYAAGGIHIPTVSAAEVAVVSDWPLVKFYGV